MATAMRAVSSCKIYISTSSMNIKAAFFHASPVLDRKRRTHWDSGGGASRGAKRNPSNSRRSKKIREHETLLRDASAFAEQLFKSWRDADYDNPSSSNSTSWFRRPYWTNGKKRTSSQGPRWETFRTRGGFEFVNGDDEDVEDIFRSALGGARFTHWSFADEEEPFRWSSAKYSNRRKSTRNWRYKRESDYDTNEELDDDSETDLVSDRVALGLSASGPLKLDDVKKAYRSCAFKWHPDRHQGSSKVDAEEKFKLCSAAYQSLCTHLGLVN